MYEALTHTRAYRKKYSTHEARKDIISSGSSLFDNRFDGGGNRLKEPRTVDLSKQFNLFVKRPLSDEEVLRKIKEEVKDEESQ